MAPRDSKPKANIKPFDRGWAQPNARSLPACIKCDRCKLLKSKDWFSARQQQIILDVARAHKEGTEAAVRVGFGSCSQCIGSQAHEMTCKRCGEVKSKDYFAKAQRRIPDDAECMRCMEKRLNLPPPDDNDDDGDISSDSNPEDDDDDDDDDLETETQTDGGISLGYNSVSAGDASTVDSNWYGIPRAGTLHSGSVQNSSYATSRRVESGSVAGSRSSGMTSSAQATSSAWAKVRSNPVDELKQLEALESDEDEDTSKKKGRADDDDDDDDFEL